MNEKKVFNIGGYKLELVVPDNTKDLSYSIGNNINAYDEKGALLWNISKLLRDYSEKNGLKYFDDMYFDVRVLDNHKVFCIGFINHCEIDLRSMQIIKLVNNR